MNIKTSSNHQQRYIDLLKSIFSAAKCYGSMHEEILEKIKARIWDDAAYRKCPRHVQAYVYGYQVALFDGLYLNRSVVWVHIWEGKTYSSWNEAPEACKQAMRENKGDSTHVWASFLPKIKRFSGSKPEPMAVNG